MQIEGPKRRSCHKGRAGGDCLKRQRRYVSISRAELRTVDRGDAATALRFLATSGVSDATRTRVPRVELVVLTEKKQGNERSEASRQVLNAARD